MKMVISFLMLVIITSCGYSSTNSLKIKVQENVFVEGSRDIALLSGMHKINEENIGFDSSAGSISSVVYSFESNPDDLLEFYFLTLSQLGWKVIDKDINNPVDKMTEIKIEKNNSQKYSFRRDKENLSIEIKSTNNNLIYNHKNSKVEKNYKIRNVVKFFFSSSL
ncbi:hypothetical protein LBMAG18_07520 [Alphaproteobacteria bacterium]|nr:hypothetical protein LBMAG18_07520 [Alphaproteobacteria bacterium]